MKHPKILYVKLERDGKNVYPVADPHQTGLAEMGETVEVGVYRLEAVKKLINASTLVDK